MDFFSRRRLGISLVLLFGLSAIAMAVDAFPPLVNWAAPATYTPVRSLGARALSDITIPQPIIFINPCRQFDIRPGVLADNTPLAVTLTGAPCGIPASATAVSVNITVFSISGAGGNGVFKVDTVSPPTPAWINYPPTETQRGNAGIVPLNGSGQIIVQVNQGGGSIQFTVDVNGYAASIPGNVANSFDLINQTGANGFAIGGDNLSTANPAFGVLGEIGSLTPGGFSAGIRGINNATTAAGTGVWGTQNGSGVGVVGQTPAGVGVLGSTDSTTAAGGGVFGTTTSTADAAMGIFGRDGHGTTAGAFVLFSSGVHGQGRDGVVGFSDTISGDGVAGMWQTTAGAEINLGVLGNSGHGVWAFAGDIGCSSCTKAFVDPHPTDPTKEIRFVSLEGNEAGTYFRGTAETAGREFVIQVPEDFRLVTDPEGLTVQLTPVGAPATMYVVSEDLNQIVVRSSRDVTFHYMVNGIRATFKNIQTIEDMSAFLPFGPSSRMAPTWADLTKQRLIANGTYNKDGTVNMETAERAGWVQKWRDEEEQARAQDAKNAAANRSTFQQ